MIHVVGIVVVSWFASDIRSILGSPTHFDRIYLRALRRRLPPV